MEEVNELVNTLPTEEVVEDTPAEEVVESEETAGEEETQELESQVDETPDPEAMREEIRKLEEQKEIAKEKAQYWRKEKAQARAEFFKGDKAETKEPVKTPVDVGPEPKVEDFEDYDKFVDAKIDYNVKKERAKWEQESAEKARNQGQQARMEELNVRLNEGFEKYTDFEEVALDQTVPITPMVMNILAESDVPADVAYYLGKNRTEAVKISRMTPLGAARAIGLIESKLASGEVTNPTPPNKKTTKAPAPIKPVGSKETVVKDPANMTQKEYNKYREEQGARRY